MGRESKPFRLLVAALLACGAPGVATADTPRLTLYGSLQDRTPVLTDVWLERPTGVTQNAEPEMLRKLSVACCTSDRCAPTAFLRVYDLDVEFALSGRFCVDSVAHASLFSSGAQDVTVNLYCLDDGQAFSMANLNRVGTRTSPWVAGSPEFLDIDVDGCCDARTQSIVVELRSNDCAGEDTCGRFYAGFNDRGQQGASYILAPDCGITEPTDLTALGFAEFHLVQVVNQVFPTTSVSVVVLVVAGLLAVLGFVLIRRRRRAH